MSQKYFDLGGFRRNAYFIDSNGQKFPILNVTRQRRSWNVAYWFAKSPAIVVDIELGEPMQLSLEEVKNCIIDLIVDTGWYRQGCESKQKFRSDLANVQTVGELIRNISFYGEWQG